MFEALTTVSQMLARNLDVLSQQPLLVCGQLEDNLPAMLAEAGPAPQVFTTDFRYFQWQQQRGFTQAEFGTQPSQGAAGLLLLMPKAKAEAEYLLAACLPLLSAGAPIFIAGDNKGGVKSAPKLLAPYSEQVEKLDSARRASLYRCELTQTPQPLLLADWIKSYSLADNELTVKTLPGVFSAGHLDSGTRLLLEQLGPLQGRILDFGCGAGVIAASLLKRQPELLMECIDINALALEATRQTLADNQLDENTKVYASNSLHQVSGQFNHIVANPPFHAGLKTFYHTTEHLLTEAKKYLLPGGTLTLVANSFLPYPELIEKSFGHCHTLAANSKFKVYQARLS